MEFKEFENPESQDYDVKSSLKVADNNNTINGKQGPLLSDELLSLVGLLEDEECKNYGITFEEYMNPTIDTLKKVSEVLKSQDDTKGKHI